VKALPLKFAAMASLCVLAAVNLDAPIVFRRRLIAFSLSWRTFYFKRMDALYFYYIWLYSSSAEIYHNLVDEFSSDRISNPARLDAAQTPGIGIDCTRDKPAG